jgi:hypothetical protein
MNTLREYQGLSHARSTREDTDDTGRDPMTRTKGDEHGRIEY